MLVGGGLLGLIHAATPSHAIESWLRDRLPFAPADPLVYIEPSIALLCLGGALLLGSVAGCFARLAGSTSATAGGDAHAGRRLPPHAACILLPLPGRRGGHLV